MGPSSGLSGRHQLAGGLGLGGLDVGQIRWAEKARHAAIWAGIVAVLILAVSYRAELAGVAQRVRMTLSPSYPVATGPRELVVSAGDGGHFLVMGEVNGQRASWWTPAPARRC